MTRPLIPNPDPAIAFQAPDGSVGDYFPLKTADAAPDTFEIGLVFGGTVSAAAYTAGVVDFLIEALDAWSVAKNAGDKAAPQHKVMIKIASGTSGGGITAVLLARALGYAFPHCGQGTPPAQRALNPLYDLWVNQVDIRDMLQLSDLSAGAPVDSLLCADKIGQVSVAVGNYVGQPLGTLGTPAIRNYVEPLLPVVLTLTNLRGIPYSSDFRSVTNRSEYYLDRADHIRFRVDVTGKAPPAPGNLKPYEIGISATPANGVQPWSTIVHAARGTSAFPVGLPPQTISRDPQHYRYRYAVIENPGGDDVVWLRPAWPYMIPIGATNMTPYQFLAVDGGCFNNEPIEYARQWLAGILGHNERDGAKAHRAVLLVDPFADAPGLGLIGDPGIFGSAGGTLSTWTSGTRFETADLDLFTAEDVFSRFLVNPVRSDSAGTALTGGDAIATSALGAFGGFLAQAFREHDFLLGRRNCQQFLRTTFVLNQSNSLFDGWSADQRAHFGGGLGGYLPVIPLMSAVAAEIPQPAWPKNAFDPASIKTLIEKRLNALVQALAKPFTSSQGAIVSWVLGLILSKAEDAGTSEVMKIIAKGLKDHGLLD